MYMCTCVVVCGVICCCVCVYLHIYMSVLYMLCVATIFRGKILTDLVNCNRITKNFLFKVFSFESFK